jgi:hypothetical protein
MKNNSGVAWSPILGQGNFHKAPRFGRVILATADHPPAPGASAATPAASGSVRGPVGLPQQPPPGGSARPGALRVPGFNAKP